MFFNHFPRFLPLFLQSHFSLDTPREEGLQLTNFGRRLRLQALELLLQSLLLLEDAFLLGALLDGEGADLLSHLLEARLEGNDALVLPTAGLLRLAEFYFARLDV